MSDVSRRKFIQGTAACSLATCFLVSTNALAEWPSKVFDAEQKNDVINGLYGDSSIEPSSLINLKTPDIAENGAVVPIKVETSLPNVESVSIFVDKNPRPLVAQFIVQPENKGIIGTRIKLAEKSNVTAVVKSNGKLYSATNYVKVTRGGCGG